MSEKPLVFLSHASSDKPRIRHIVEGLLDRGFRLFIDHPERFTPPFSREDCERLGIESLWSTDNSHWPSRLNEAIDACDCVLVILSQALTYAGIAEEDLARRASHRIEWRQEITRGDALRKLAFARIESFGAETLPSCLRGEDAVDLKPGMDAAAMSAGLDILASNRIAAAMKKARKFGPDEPGALDHFRAMRELLPLCVGRKDQRRRIIDSAKSAALGQIRPVIVVGPENELPVDFIRAISFADTGQQTGQTFVLNLVDLPLGTGDAFARELVENLGEEFLNDYGAGLPAVAEQIANVGHPTIVHVRHAVSAGNLGDTPLLDWIAFWEQFGAAFPRLPVVPVASLLLANARPGWQDCPPSETESPEERTRNLAAWRWLNDQCGAPAAARFLLPPITAPIAWMVAQRWADDIREDVLPGAARQRLRREVDDILFGDAEVRRFGVNHKTFRDRLVAWFEAA